MKSTSLRVMGVALCVALAAMLSWSALPTHAEGDQCPLKAAKAGEKGACAAKAAAGEGACKDGAKPASLAKADAACCKDGAKPAVAEGEKCDKAANASLAANKSGECGEVCPEGAKNVAGEKGACEGKNLAALLTSDNRFTTLALAVKAAGMADVLNCPKQKTVFAPTNDAFQRIPAEQWAALLQDDAKLKAVLANHIVADNAIQACQIKDAKNAKSSGGCDLVISACPQSGTVSINNAKVVGDALVASNGVVHAIDSVLLPADLQLANTDEAAPADVQVATAK